MVFFAEVFDQHVINVHLHGFADQFSENYINKALVCCPNVLQAERHNLVPIETAICGERHHVFIIRAHAYLIITRVGIHEAK